LVIEKDNQERELESSAEDFVTFAIQIQKTIDAKGEGRMLKVHDANKYWDDIVKLFDTDGGKTRAAVQAILSGKFSFSFSPVNGIMKILQNKIPTTDPDVRGVKEHFFETCAAVLIDGQKMLKLKEIPERTNPLFSEYASLYEKLLRLGFLGQADKTNILDAYKKYVDAIRIDHGDLMRRIHEQEKYVEFLRQLLVNAQNNDLPNRARAVLDAYWRLCELCYPMLYTAQVAISFAEGKTVENIKPSFDDLVKSLLVNSEAKDLVQNVEPVLRNSEAHCASSIIMEGGKPLVVAYESRSYPARELKRFPLSDVIEKVNILARSLLTALYFTLEIFEYAFLLLVLNSYEFKMRLVTLDQY
jgi:hypothetical protein